MARIRTIKPEFWTSEQIAECSPNVRLLFIGLWNFCDDYGVHPAKIMSLKMQVFPADAFTKDDMQKMVNDLISEGLLIEYVIDNEAYWYVTGWDKHQKPDTKTGKWPRPDGQIGGKIRRTYAERTPNVQGQFADHSPPEKEKEKEKEKEINTPPPPARARTRETGFDEKKIIEGLPTDEQVLASLNSISAEIIEASHREFLADMTLKKKAHAGPEDLKDHFVSYTRIYAKNNILKNGQRQQQSGRGKPRRANGYEDSLNKPAIESILKERFGVDIGKSGDK